MARPVWLRTHLHCLGLEILRKRLRLRRPTVLLERGAAVPAAPRTRRRLLSPYGIARDHVDYIMETFPIVKRKDEQKYGEYRTKRVILEIYDAIAEAIRTGKSYQTRLDPPPADPRIAHPLRERVSEDARE